MRVVLDWLIGLVLVGADLYAVRVLRSEWRGTDGADPYQAPEWWPFDLPAWRALIRSGPAGAVEAVLVGASYLVSLVDNSPSQAHSGSSYRPCSSSTWR